MIDLAGVALLLVVMACSCPSRIRELSGDQDRSTPRPTPETVGTPPSRSASTGEYQLSMEKYNRIKNGSRRADVENILGGKGTEVSSSVGGGIKFSVDKWEGESFKSIIISFRNDRVISKSQVGLK